MLTRRTPMARGSGFKRPAYAARPAREQDDTPSTTPPRSRVPCNASMTPVQGPVSPIAKENPLRSEPYRRLVAALPCAYCRRVGHSQHAHENEAKGKALKLDDRRAMPLCADDFGVLGCHSRFDRYALFMDRAEHVRMGRQWAAETRAQIETLGLWPRNLPRWTE